MTSGEGGLTKDAHALCERVTSLDKRFFVRAMGDRIHDKYRHQLIKGVRRAMGEPDPFLKSKVGVNERIACLITIILCKAIVAYTNCILAQNAPVSKTDIAL